MCHGTWHFIAPLEAEWNFTELREGLSGCEFNHLLAEEGSQATRYMRTKVTVVSVSQSIASKKEGFSYRMEVINSTAERQDLG